MTMWDLELINNYLESNNEEVISQLLEKYLQYIFNVAYSFVWDKNRANDITQEVCYKIIKNLKLFNQKSQFKTWIYSIIHNEAINKISDKNNFVDVKDYEYSESDDEISIKKDLNWKYVSDIVMKELWTMNPFDSSLIISFYYENLSIKEIAKATWESESNVKTRLCRARKLLKTKLSEYGIID